MVTSSPWSLLRETTLLFTPVCVLEHKKKQGYIKNKFFVPVVSSNTPIQASYNFTVVEKNKMAGLKNNNLFVRQCIGSLML